MKSVIDIFSIEIAEAILKGIMEDMKKNINVYSERELISCCIIIDAITRIVEQVSERFKLDKN